MARLDELRERLLAVMDRKDHWAWPHLTRPGLSRGQLLAHFRHEYQVYVRDFPVLLARVLGQGPPGAVRRALAENLYEEQTGGLSFGVAHPELFLEMMDGLGLSREAVAAADPPLEPEALAYRALLDRRSAEAPWIVGAAVLTIFVEGSVHERAEVSGGRALPPIEDAIRAHPMVAHYGCPPAMLRLPRAHRAVEAGHRRDAWEMVLGHAGEGEVDAIVRAVEEAHAAWRAYRDGVARAMGIARTLDVALRPATEADVPAILPMMIAFNEGEHIPWDPAAGEGPLRRLIATPGLGRVSLISVAGAIAGYAIVTFGFDLEFGGRDAFLTELYLKPEARGQGVGRRAIDRILEVARAEGAGAIHLQVRDENLSAQRVYRAAGFVGTARILLTRVLDEAPDDGGHPHAPGARGA